MADKPDEPAQPKREGSAGVAAFLAAAASTLGLAGILGGVVVFVVTGRFSRWAWIPMAAGGGLIVISGLLNPRQVLALLRRRRARLGANMAAMILLVAGIAVLVNYAAARRHHRFDFTRSRQHSLSQQTRKIVKGLKQDVEMVSFYSRRTRDSRFQEMADLLDEYHYASNRVKTRVVDIYTNPAEAQKYNITSPSVTVVSSGDRREEVFGPSEQDLTSAILKVTRKERKKIYFLIGHGEHDPTAFGPQAYADAKRALDAAHYDVLTLNLATRKDVPKDCAVLVVGGPQKPLDPRETEAVNRYLDDDGRALFLLDPDPAPPLDDILDRWGIKPLPGTVVEPVYNIWGPSTVVITHYTFHEITRPFTTGRALGCVFITPRAFERIPQAAPTLRVADVIQTSSDSWLETSFAGRVQKDSSEKAGPLTLMMAVSTGPPPPPPGMPPPPNQPKEKPRLVVIGDADFVTDDYFGSNANGDLFLNSVNWLAGEMDLVAIAPKPREEHTILLDKVQARKTLVLLVVAVPLAVLLAGGWVWWRRR